MIKKLLLLLTITLNTTFFFAQETTIKKDTIAINNDIIITGNIKKLDLLKLTINTSYNDGTVDIKWDQVTSIKSDKHFIFCFIKGERIRAQLVSLNKDFIELAYEGTKHTFLRKQLITFKLEENIFSDRFNSHVDLSLSQKKALNFFQYNIDLGANYDTSKFSYLFEVNLNSVYTNSNSNINRFTLNTGFNKYLKNNFFITYRLKLFKNSQQNIDLRTISFSSFGVNFIQKPKIKAKVDVGLSVNHEKFSYNSSFHTSIEIYSGLQIKLLHFNSNTLEFKTHHYLSTTTSNRFRADSELEYKHDLPNHFYMKASYTYNYDNSISDSSKKLDYVANLGLGWSFK